MNYQNLLIHFPSMRWIPPFRETCFTLGVVLLAVLLILRPKLLSIMNIANPWLSELSTCKVSSQLVGEEEEGEEEEEEEEVEEEKKTGFTEVIGAASAAAGRLLS